MRLLVQKALEQPGLLDTSELLRPEAALKDKEAFRDYTKDSVLGERVRRTYTEMHTHQTMAFVLEKQRKWLKFDHMEATVMEALDMLNSLVDESDPDTELPNIVHAFQTAERIREQHPDKDWFHLIGLIHDLGKIMAFYGEPQWAVVGDTFPVGCLPQPSIVFGQDSFQGNPDMGDSRYNTKLGVYSPNCGMEQVTMSWGHDEYLYQVLVNHMAKVHTTIPDGGLWAVRFHSCYPWHTGGDYSHLARPGDEDIMDWVKEFNKFDLYTKSPVVPDIEALKPYYQGLVDKYLPGVISF